MRLLESVSMRAVLAVTVALVALAGCKKKREGLPPAQEWSVPELGALDVPGAPPGLANPHGGGGNPHGEGMAFDGTDPHAGIDMSGMGGDPHANVDMSGVDVTQMLPPPDPSRPIDPNRRITGVVKLDPKLKDRVKPSSVLFVFAKRPGPDGEPTGFPIASDKLVWTDATQLAFSLTDEDLMSAGSELTGDVILMARIDQDHDAISKQSGDVVGQLRVKIPADNVALTLGEVLQ